MLSGSITTFSKVHFIPTNPTAADIKIEDIAHALSMMCRANGHVERFFSVAQHSINCSLEAKARGYSKKVQLACLMQDACKAYLADIPRTVKSQLPQYVLFEENLQMIIYRKYLDSELTEEEKTKISEIEDSMLYYEVMELMEEKICDIEPALRGTPNFATRDFKVIEHQFLNTYTNLIAPDASRQSLDRNIVSVGIDSCMGKWLVVALTDNGFEVNLIKNIGDVCKKYKDADSIIVDMPIGLPESLTDIRPDCELRKRLKGKASVVFNTPCRQAVYAANYTKAIEENRKVLQGSISPCANAMIPKIREIDSFLCENSEWKNRLVESHPEFCFAALNKNNPILDNRQTLLGVQKRMEALSKYYPESYAVVEQFQKISHLTMSSKLDHVIDALALAVIGVLGTKNGFFTIPTVPMEDSRKIKMQIMAAKI